MKLRYVLFILITFILSIMTMILLLRWYPEVIKPLLPAGNQSMSTTKEMEKSPAGKKDQEILYWKSPMDPTFISQQPGKDPMGMDLVPVYAGEETQGPPGEVRIDPVMVQKIGVTTTPVERKRLTHEIRTIGRITYDEQKERRISPKIGGWIEKQYVNFTGQVVARGEKLLEIYSPELVSTQQEYLTTLGYYQRMKDNPVRTVAEGAASLLQAAEMRLRYWDITKGQIDALRRHGKITQTMALYAPFKGIVVERNIPEGGFLQPGQMVYGIADISTVWVIGEVYEFEAPWLKLDQEAEMSLAYQPGKTYQGKIVYIYPYLQNMTRTIRVRMVFSNTKDFELKPDMWANVLIRSTIVHDGLAVPIQAVLRTGKRNIALIALGEGRFSPRELHLGAQAGDEFQVLEGLKEGESVVTSAQFLINSESNLRAAISKMLPPEKSSEAKPDEAGQHSKTSGPTLK
ncbi:MAG: efflux RND transporter periplasmic adaptor subunit [Desulfobacterales bacterium]